MEAMVDTLGNERWEGYLITDSKYTDVKLIFYIVITFVAGVNIKNFVDVNMDSRKINRVTEMSSNRQSILKNG